MVLVNGQNLDMFGDLESFEDSIPEINKVLINSHEYECYGTHKELLQSCEVYQEIANSQMSKEELENA